jgi:hypothetical protein
MVFPCAIRAVVMCGLLQSETFPEPVAKHLLQTMIDTKSLGCFYTPAP